MSSCNPNVQFREFREAIKQDYAHLLRQDQDDPMVKEQLARNRQLHQLFKEVSGGVNERIKEVRKVLNEKKADAEDALTNQFRARFDNEMPIYVGGRKRKERIKRVDVEDNKVTITTYTKRDRNDVRTYTFEAGSDTGVVNELGKQPQQARVNTLGDMTKSLQRRGLLKSSEFTNEAIEEEAVRLDGYVHGNVNTMVGMIDTFARANEDKGYIKHLKKLIGEMSPKFFKELELWVGQAKGEDALGRVSAERMEVYANSANSRNRNSQSLAEVYAHEVVHSVTMFALGQHNDKARRLRRELTTLVKDARKAISKEDLYPVNASETEKKVADELYDYMFHNEKGTLVGDQEFLAHAVTNPIMMDRLKAIGLQKEGEEELSLLDKVVAFFNKAMRILLGEASYEDLNSTMYGSAVNLLHRLGEINNEAKVKESRLISSTDAVIDVVNRVDEYVAEGVSAVKDKVIGENDLVLPEKYPENGTRLEKEMYILKYARYALTRPEYRKAFGLMLSAHGVSPTSSIREFVGSFFERSSMDKAVDWLGLAAGRIDTMRESLVNSDRALVLEGFDRELSEVQDEALTKFVIDTDVGSLYKDYGLEGIKEFYSNPQAVAKELKVLKDKLRKENDKDYRWLEAQAHGLGYYMSTHKGHIAQNSNAGNIARGLLKGDGISDRIEYKKEVEDLVSKIATLTAIEYSRGKGEDVLVKLIEEKPEGVRNVINMYEGFKEEAKKEAFVDDEIHLVQGYSTELFDENVEIEVMPSKEAKALKRLGFKEVKKLNKFNQQGEKLSVFVSEGYGVKERLRGATRLLSKKARGTSVKHSIGRFSVSPKLETKVTLAKLSKERERLARAMEDGTFTPDMVEENMLALMDGDGKVIDYRYMMDKDSKKTLMKQDTRASEVIAKTKGHLLDKVFTVTHNENVLDLIKKDMEANFKGKKVNAELTEYAIINETGKYKDLYDVLPKAFKEYAQSRPDKSIAVPANLLMDYFGYEHISIAHNKWSKYLPRLMNKLLGTVEEFWMDLIKIVKSNILMKMPIVLIGNIVSNFMFRVLNGANPFRLLKDYVTSFQDVRAFMKNNREVVRLSSELQALEQERLANPSKELDEKIKDKKADKERAEAQNADNPVKELVDSGLYQAIVEDVETKVIEGSTVWDKVGNKVFGRLPKGAKTAFDTIYFNQNSSWYKFNQEVLQLSDLVARDVQNKSAKIAEEKVASGKIAPPAWWRKEKNWGIERKIQNKAEREEFLKKAKEVRMYSLMENYVNYARPSGRGEEYLNRMGVMMFTKYAKRIQKVIMDQSTHYPVKTFLGLLVNEGLMDMSMIQDQHILAKEWHSETHGAGNFLPFYGFGENIENALTPALIKESTWSFLPI